MKSQLRFLSWRCRPAWLFALATAVFLAALRFGPMDEQSTLECAFAFLILAGLVLFAIAASGRIAFGLFAGSLPMLLLVIAANLKFQYLSTPLLAPDLVYYANAEIAQTLLRYPFLIAAILAAMVLVPLLLVLLWRGDLRPKPSVATRSARACGIVAALVLLAMTLHPRGPFASVYDKGMWEAMNDESFVSDFVASIRNAHVSEPSFTPADATRDDWRDLAASGPAGRQKPDIVAVLEESTFDPRMLTACTAKLCDVGMFQPDANTIAHGWLNVHTWGGGTWTSEFAFMSGLPHTLFGPAGIYAPFNLAPRIRYTLPRLLDADGYRTVGIYPTDGDFMNGRDAYADYGFDAFYGGQELNLDWGVTDAQVFAALQRVFKTEKARAGGKPLFVFVLTLYQHGPHMTPYKEMPAPYDKPLFPGKLASGDSALDDWLNLNLTNYLQRVSMSSAAMAQLEAFLRSDNRPVLLLHFGDHQPSFDGAINALAKTVPPQVADAQYTTYYMLKGFNLPIRREDYPVLDIAYLGSLLLDAANLPRDPFFVANTLLRDRCDGHDLDCRNAALRDSYRAYVFGNLHDLGD
ncbi:MAG: Capsular polysaccharide biosynthesis protein WcbQ [Rhodanobacteraceae bacterium]|jgi:phosphoglycerol transferase MdoB-like AlkP superfamily enzyme|nr:MAG: Capsular polysaccharide biosynthesis protein WcbQ [Rhodanobacteraceae bacterium]